MIYFIIGLNLLFSTLVFAASSVEDVTIIVNKNNPIAQMKKIDLKNIYLGITRNFPIKDGSVAKVIDYKSENDFAMKFHQDITNKNRDELRKHWAEMVFTGKSKEPIFLTDDQAVIEMVKNDEDAIGYVHSSVAMNTVGVKKINIE